MQSSNVPPPGSLTTHPFPPVSQGEDAPLSDRPLAPAAGEGRADRSGRPALATTSPAIAFVPPPRKRSLLARLWPLAIVLGGCALAAGGVAMVRIELLYNYVVFDGVGPNQSVAIDGHVAKDEARVGAGRAPGAPIVVKVGTGHHTVAILDAAGKTLEQDVIDLPTRGARAVYSAGVPRKYTFVTVPYGALTKAKDLPDIPLEPSASPRISFLPPTRETFLRDLTSVDRRFPASVLTKRSSDELLSSFCRQSPDGDLGCVFERPKPKAPPAKK